MGAAVKQVEKNGGMTGGAESNRPRRLSDRLPKSFREYLDSEGYEFDVLGRRGPGRESLAELAERARRAPRTG